MGRPRKEQPRFYRVTETFAFVDPEDGMHYNFHVGEIMSEKLAKKCRMFVEPLERGFPGVERTGGTATVSKREGIATVTEEDK